MAFKIILETERLTLREFILNDAEFILKLVNTPPWLEFIGDKNVHSIGDAEMYLEEGPMKSYQENGFGLWMVLLKGSKTPVGMCGLVNRETLDDVDIGFALLPEHSLLGYGYESAYATLNYAKQTLGIDKVVAVTNETNISSIKLLNKLGLSFERTVQLAENDVALLFSVS